MQRKHHALFTCTALLSFSLLSACAMTPPPQAPHFKKFDRKNMQRPHDQAFKHVCDGKEVGATVQVNVNDRVFNGQCQLRFQPMPPQS
ncbi:hypothetical protein I2F27_03225 [Acinetobacter sp. B5B]|uniref:hypothetical protein n=1 Tax=Acinetobacter baretiae TaxID=2605383 RepID=UPI0018C2A525|nr:hypothetical protein [Acinetobacter baretiae]MBF7682345.1 hypothetical protein [Acinetobacter baretiae]